MSDRLELQQQVNVDDAPGALFLQRVLERGIRNVRTDRGATSAADLTTLGQPLLRVFGGGTEAALLDFDGVLADVSLSGGMVHVSAAHDDEGRLDATLRVLRDALPAPDPTSSHEVTVTFWTYCPHGPMPAARSIAVPGWDEIRANYAAPTRASLEQVMADFQPAHGGQLIL